MKPDLRHGFRVGCWRVEPLRGAITGPEDQEHHLQPKVMDVLVYLASRPAEPVTRDELLTAVWGERAATDEPLTRVIAELRHALGDDARHPRYIETIPKRGYRLLVSPTTLEDESVSWTSKPGQQSPTRRFRAAAIILVFLVAAVVGVISNIAIREPAPAPAQRIAVLPFVALSMGPDDEYFSDGISEEILNALAEIGSLKVIARQSSFSFKGKDVDIATIAEQLNVRHILEGSVRRSGDRVRITVQLIDAKDSSHLWSETYDRAYSAENLFEIQSEIARAITGRLRMTLTGDEEERFAEVPTQNTEAYAAYLLGRERLKNRKVAELADAVEQFSLAIELDPEFAGAYAGLADACGLYASYSGGQNEIYEYDSYSGGKSDDHCPSSLAGREQLARKALELDPKSAEAWISLGSSIWELAVRMHGTETLPMIDEKFQESFAAFERGLDLYPAVPEA